MTDTTTPDYETRRARQAARATKREVAAHIAKTPAVIEAYEAYDEVDNELGAGDDHTLIDTIKWHTEGFFERWTGSDTEACGWDPDNELVAAYVEARNRLVTAIDEAQDMIDDETSNAEDQ